MVVGGYNLTEIKITDFGIAKMAEAEMDEAAEGGVETLSASATAVAAFRRAPRPGGGRLRPAVTPGCCYSVPRFHARWPGLLHAGARPHAAGTRRS